MTTLTLVRHGEAATAWGTEADADPGLSDRGHHQAVVVADALGPRGARSLLVSPRRRTLETVAPIEAAWDLRATVEPRVDEVAAPGEHPGSTGRPSWLREVLASRWGDLPAELRAWRRSVLDALVSQEHDTVVVTHFIAINVAVGEATDDDRVVCSSPDHCSRTVLATDGVGLHVIDPGDEARTDVL